MSILSSSIKRFDLEPLLSTCRRLRSRHVSLFGSAVRRELSDLGDLDLHVVLPRIEGPTFELIVAAARATVELLASETRRSGSVELRHGPFKPPSGADRDLQLHLILDDHASLEQSSCALLAHRSATGLLLMGEPLSYQGRAIHPVAWLKEAHFEMTRWRAGLSAGEIVFRHWQLDPKPHLAEGQTAAKTGSDLNCLLKGAATSSDLHYRAALLMASAGPRLVEDLAYPLLSQLEEPPSTQTLLASWERVKDQAIAVLDRRLDQLLCILGKDA